VEKLLIIGAGIGQVPLLEKAKARGLHVTVASIPGPYPCFLLADDVIYTNIYDRDEIVNEARKREITAIVSDQNDLMMPTVAYVAEKLGLPGNRFETVMAYCNKNTFRELCDKVEVPCPKHVAIGSGEINLDNINFPLPWIVKPADSQSSIGIKKIEDKRELKIALHEAISKSPTHAAIVEEFFEGRELVCEGFINNGKYYLLAFADRRYFNLDDVMIPSQTLFPSSISKTIQDKIVKYEQMLSMAMKPSFGIVHSEYLINEKTGEICIVESALRGGGVYISSDLIPMATGIDINDVLLDKALGIDVDVDEIFEKRNDKASAYVCFYLPEGVIEKVEGVDELKKLPFVKKFYIDDIIVGQKMMPPTYKGARKGPILVQGKNREDLEQNILTVQKTLKATVMAGDNKLYNLHWS